MNHRLPEGGVAFSKLTASVKNNFDCEIHVESKTTLALFIEAVASDLATVLDKTRDGELADYINSLRSKKALRSSPFWSKKNHMNLFKGRLSPLQSHFGCLNSSFRGVMY